MSDCVVSEMSIECDTEDCNKADGGWEDDALLFAEDMYDKGWRTNLTGHAICPKCAKKSKPKDNDTK